MAKMDELYNEIYDLCVECGRVVGPYTAKDWNEHFKNTYGSGAFTALVNAGKMTKEKGWRKSDPYYYTFIPTGKLEEEMEKSKREHEKNHAEWTIANYDKYIEGIKTRYEEAIRQAEEMYQRDLAFEEQRLKEAKETLGIL